MAWMVVVDHLEPLLPDGSVPAGSAVGIGQWQGADPPSLATLPRRCKLYDDDGELYYTVAYDQAADDLDEEWGGLYECWRWGMYYAGSTDLRIDGEAVYG